MATGALDANGIWQYGEDDSEPTFSGMLNKLASSTSTTVTRLEELSGLTAAQLTTHRDNLGVGLVNVVPSSVAQAGGSASANAQGLVTFTGVTSVSLNGVFTSTYSKYKILISNVSGTINAALQFRLRNAGADRTDSSYAGRGLFATSATSGLWTDTGASVSFSNLEPSVAWICSDVTIYNPANAGYRTVYNSVSTGLAASSNAWISNAGQYGVANANDGFTIYPGSGNMTGTVQVFGYNE